jgi:hypothetical protein
MTPPRNLAMTRACVSIIVFLAIVAMQVLAQDWTKESKDRAKRAALHDSSQLVRGDSGKWNDDASLLHAPPLAQKPAKMSLDAWADQILKKKLAPTAKDDNWLIFRSEQLDDNDRVWIERIERRGPNITIAANQAKWQGKYFRNFTFYQVIAINLGKLDVGKYDVTWVSRHHAFAKFDGDGKAIDSNWPKDERALDKKPTELRLAITVKQSD